jgi:hypothetical protein
LLHTVYLFRIDVFHSVMDSYVNAHHSLHATEFIYISIRVADQIEYRVPWKSPSNLD